MGECRSSGSPLCLKSCSNPHGCLTISCSGRSCLVRKRSRVCIAASASEACLPRSHPPDTARNKSSTMHKTKISRVRWMSRVISQMAWCENCHQDIRSMQIPPWRKKLASEFHMSHMFSRKVSTSVDRWPQDYPYQSGPRSITTFVPTSDSIKKYKIKRSRYRLVKYLRLPKFALECFQNILFGMPGPGVRTDQVLPVWQENQD